MESWGEARGVFESAINIDPRLRDSELAVSFNHLGTLIYLQGDYSLAVTNFETALAIQEKLPSSPELEIALAQTLKNLAGASDAMGDHEKALSCYRRAIQIFEKDRGNESKLKLAQSLDDLASSLEDQKSFDEALPLFVRALKIKEELLGADNIELASSLNNIGVLYMDLKKPEARTYFSRALEISEKALSATPNHIDLVPLLNNSGDLELITHDYGLAFNYYLRAAKIVDSYFSEVLPYLSNAEKYALFERYSREQISRLLSVCKSPAQAREAYQTFFRWKGTLVSALARESKFARSAKSTELIAQVKALSNVRAELASWYLQVGSMRRAVWESRNVELTKKKEALERAVAQADPDFALDDKSSLEGFAKLLRPDEAIVDFYCYQKSSDTDSQLTYRSQYAVIVVTAPVPGREPNIFSIDLGDQSKISQSEKLWREDVLAFHPAVETFNQLCSIFDPVFSRLPSGIKKVWISPEGELARVPWNLVSQNTPHPLANLTVCQIDSARELIELRSQLAIFSDETEPIGNTTSANAPVANTPVANAAVNQQAVLVLGGVDFNFGTNAQHASQIIFSPLPGTLLEANKITSLAKSAGKAVVELTGKAASKESLLQEMPKASYAHIATHGFFLSVSDLNQSRGGGANPANSAASNRGVMVKMRTDESLSSRNPLVESGLALSGANKTVEKIDDSNSGIITAEELSTADFSQCKLATLSACDTGLGKELTGQGIMGLRSALMAAGARCVLLSLWKIPDDVTVMLMQEFYKNLWTNKMDPADALRRAQDTIVKQIAPGINKPKSWAGWVLVGEGWK